MAASSYFKVIREGLGLITKQEDVFPFDASVPEEQLRAFEQATAWARAHRGRIVSWRSTRFALGGGPTPIVGENT